MTVRNNDMFWWFEEDRNAPKWAKSLTVSPEGTVRYWSLSISEFADRSIDPKQLIEKGPIPEDIECIRSVYSYRWEAEPRHMIIDRPDVDTDEVELTSDPEEGQAAEQSIADKLVAVFCDKVSLEDAFYEDSANDISEQCTSGNSMQPAEDNVNHPSHYTSHPSGVECIEITEHYDFCVGNAIKYLWRAGLKQDADKTELDKELEDLQKAKWYIDRKISLLTKNKEER